MGNSSRNSAGKSAAGCCPTDYIYCGIDLKQSADCHEYAHLTNHIDDRSLYQCAKGNDPILLKACPDWCSINNNGNDFCIILANETSGPAIRSNGVLLRGHSVWSVGRKTRLTMQEDGNLVLYRDDGKRDTVPIPLWVTATNRLVRVIGMAKLKLNSELIDDQFKIMN